jgi:tetratricopeptide (TPR) repeat protein
MPVLADNYYEGIGGVNPDKTYEVFINTNWGNLNNPKVNVDRESDRNSRLPRQNYLRAAETFLARGDKAKAVELLDRCIYYFPDSQVQYDMMMIPFAEIYYGAGETDKANAVVSRLIDIFGDDMRYYDELKPSFAERHYSNSIDRTVRIMRNLSQLARMNGQEELAARADEAIGLMGS